MKKLLFTTSIILALSACGQANHRNQAPAASQAAASATASADNPNLREVLVGTEANFFPLRYRDGQNAQPSGFQIEVLSEAAKATNLKFTYQITPDAPKLDKLANAPYTATLATFDPTTENTTLADFTEPITTTKFVVHLKSDQSGTGSLNELQGKTISIDSYYAQNPNTMALLEKLTGSRKNIIVESHLFPAWQNMVKGKTDGVFGEDLVLNNTYATHKANLNIQIKNVDVGLPSNERALLLKKGNPELLQQINNGINIIKQNGTYDALKAKWFPDIK